MKTFHPDCTLPSSEPVFVSSPNVRGTLNIVWSCLTVLILCTWSIQHPNLPFQFRDQTFLQMVRFQLRQARTKTFYMILAVLMPEWFVVSATSELMNACRHTKLLKELADGTDVRWTITHSFFANMGGFQIEFNTDLMNNTREEEEERGSLLPSLSEAQETEAGDHRPTKDISEPNHFRAATTYAMPLFSRDHGDTSKVLLDIGRQDPVPSYLERASRFGKINWKPLFRDLVRDFIKEICRRYEVNSQQFTRVDYGVAKEACFFQGNIWTVNASQLVTACRQGYIDLPDVTEKELMDRSKSDVMVKLLAIIQGSWLVIQLISRFAWNPKLPCSQLEVGTVAITTCMLSLYILLWYKPQNVSTTVIVVAKRAPTRAEIQDIVLADGSPTLRTGFVIPQFKQSATSGYWSDRAAIMAGCAAGTVMGSLHLLAWRFAFPTHVEALLWKVTASFTAGFPAFVYLWMGLAAAWERYIPRAIGLSVLAVMWLFYMLARLVLTVEMFRCLYYLPPAGYIATWTSEIPSIG